MEQLDILGTREVSPTAVQRYVWLVLLVHVTYIVFSYFSWRISHGHGHGQVDSVMATELCGGNRKGIERKLSQWFRKCSTLPVVLFEPLKQY